LYTILDPQIQSTLRRFPGFADKKVYEIAQQLENSKNEPLRRLLHGLSIPNIGKKIAMSIQEALQTEHKEDNITTNTIIKYLINTEFLNNIYGIGDKIVQ
jgi:DNA ligase (NAD+)